MKQKLMQSQAGRSMFGVGSRNLDIIGHKQSLAPSRTVKTTLEKFIGVKFPKRSLNTRICYEALAL